jgi:hypothetical protein
MYIKQNIKLENRRIIKELNTVHLNNKNIYNTYNWKNYAKNGYPV